MISASASGMLRWFKLPAHSRLGCAPGLRFDKSSGWRTRALHPQLLRPFASTSPRLTLAMSLPSKMKAITIAKPGEVDVVEQTEMPVPEAQPGHVLIKVAYAGNNFIDTYYRKGLYPAEYPLIIGMECSGTVVALPTDEKVLGDPEYQKRKLEVGSHVATVQLGAFAEYVSAPWAKVVPLPAAVPLRTAAAALLQGLTALTFITEAYDVKKGDTILVHTVAGGLGLLFSQLISARGATVIGTTSSDEKAELARANGATHVILYRHEDTVKRVLELTGGKGVDGVFDGVGKDTFEADFEMLKRKGTLVSVGNASGAVPPFAPLKLMSKNLKLVRPSLFNYLTEPEEVWSYGTKLFELIANGELNVKVHKEYEFTGKGVQDAQTDLVSGKTTGKLVIRVSGE